MIEHWYEYLPAAWFTPEGRWYVIVSILLLMTIAFVAGYVVGRKRSWGSVLLIIFYVENLDVGSWGVKNDV